MRTQLIVSALALMLGSGLAQAETVFNLGFVGGPAAPEAIGMGQFATEIAERTEGRYKSCSRALARSAATATSLRACSSARWR